MMRALLVPAALLLIAASPSTTAIKNPEKLVILSVTDVKGKPSPCGCHTPKGGFSRQANFADSIRAEYGQVLLVDNGGYFPELDHYEDNAVFMMQTMNTLGFDVVGTGARDLRFGLDFLVENVKKTGLPQISSNLFLKNGKAVFPTSQIKKVGGVKVGTLSVISDKVDLGPSASHLTVKDPATVVKAMVPELRKKGATVIVLLSQLGKIETEDLVAAVEGIDLAVVGMNAPLMQNGRVIKNTVMCYGGEQGQNMGRTLITLDARGRKASGENMVQVLSPDIGEKPSVLAMVKAFEDEFNARQRARQKEDLAKAEAAKQESGESADHYLGAEVCARCHTSEFQQWQSTSHAQAWETLVEAKKDATPECISCHVVGYEKPGGFQTAADANKLADVQCENCHGMGTLHDSYPATSKQVTAEACASCHNATTSPTFDFATYSKYVDHQHKDLPPLPESPAKKMKMMQGHGSGH